MDNQSGSSQCVSSLLTKLKCDVVYRRKLLLSAALCQSYVMLGWIVLQIGPALPDLQHLVDVDLKTVSWIFTTWSIGFIVGSLISGFLYDHCNRLLVAFICNIGGALCYMCTPFSGSFYIMVFVRLISGIFCGGIDTGANTIMPSIWGSENGPYMQAMYFAYSIGGIASPFATRSFMLQPLKQSTDQENINITGYTRLELGYGNTTDATVEQANLLNGSLVTLDISSEDLTIPVQESKIHNAFIITSILVICTSIPYLLMLGNGLFDIWHKDHTDKNYGTLSETEVLREQRETKEDSNLERQNGKRKLIILICVSGVNLMYNATEECLGDFIVIFCLDYLNWDNAMSVTLLSLYWSTSCIGGLAGIYIVYKIGPGRLLFIAHIFWLLTFILSIIGGLFRLNILIWISVPASGLFMVQIIPAVISWTEKNVCDITGRISAVFMISTGVGIAGNPSVIGYLMDRVSYMSLMYVLTVEAVICFGLLSLAFKVRLPLGRDNVIAKSSLLNHNTHALIISRSDDKDV